MTSLLDAAVSRLLGELPTLSARARGDRVRQVASSLDVAEQTVYRRLKEAGWSSGRKPRADKGRSALSEADGATLAALMAKGKNKRGQPNVPTREAHAIALEQGLIAADLSHSQVCRRLRQLGLDRERMTAPEPGIARVSQYPNHVWFADISVGIQWYFRDPETGKNLDLYQDAGSRFYEGKRNNFDVRRVIHRYIAVDHRSGCYWVQYFYSPGENAEDVVNFLWSSMAPKEDLSDYPFQGVPKYLVADQGSAFKNGLVRGLLEGLGITLQLHRRRNAKANGAVESRHNHWQRYFEGRLADRGAPDLETLNLWAQRSCVLANTERPHTRHGRTPIEAWQDITAEQLTLAPERRLFFQLAASGSKTGVLTNRLYLRADGREWEIGGQAVYPGQRVRYRLSPFLDAGLRVWDTDGQELTATEIRKDAAGFALNGRRHVWDGEEHEKGSQAPLSPAAKIAADVADGVLPVALPTLFDDLGERLDRLSFLPVTGKAWAPPVQEAAAETMAEPLLSSLEARDQVVARLERGLTFDEADWWKAAIGTGVTSSQLDELLALFLSSPSALTQTG